MNNDQDITTQDEQAQDFTQSSLVEQAFEEEMDLQKKRILEEAREEEQRLLRESLSERARVLEEIGMKAELDPLPSARVSIDNIQKDTSLDHTMQDNQGVEWDGESMSATIRIAIGKEKYDLGRMKFEYRLQPDGKFGAKIKTNDRETMRELERLQRDRKIDIDRYLKKIEQELNEAVPMEFQFDQLSIDSTTPEGREIMRRMIDGEDLESVRESLAPDKEEKKELDHVPAGMEFSPF